MLSIQALLSQILTPLKCARRIDRQKEPRNVEVNKDLALRYTRTHRQVPAANTIATATRFEVTLSLEPTGQAESVQPVGVFKQSVFGDADCLRLSYVAVNYHFPQNLDGNVSLGFQTGLGTTESGLSSS